MSSDDSTSKILPKHGLFTFIWKIENFSFCPHNEEYHGLESPRFNVESLDNSEWYLSIFPGKAPVTCHVYRPNNKEEPEFIRTNFMYSFVTADGTHWHWCEMKDLNLKKGTLSGYIEMDRRIRNFKDIFLPNDTLTVVLHMWKSDDCATTINTRCTARTSISVERRLFDCQINNFLQYRCRSNIPVKVASKRLPSFEMIFSCTGGAVSDEKLLIKVRRLANAEKKSLFLACKISVLNKNGDVGFSAKEEHRFSASENENEWIVPPFIRVNKIAFLADMYLQKNCLTLRCEFAISHGILFNEIEECSYVVPEDQTKIQSSDAERKTLSSDLLNMCNQGTLCDVKLSSGDETLPAHWLILCARSDVFKAMFESDMTEKASGIVTIPNLEAEDLKRLLVFLYTDSLEDLSFDSATSLYTVADLYHIEELKRKCANFLVCGTSVANVCACLQFGDLYQDDILMNAVTAFICEHKDVVYKSDDWKNLILLDSSLTARIMLLVSNETI
ncbi:hypothetical protein JTE90_017323 [Oedothorax gibbosus]|uniref:BTB domain-containing protein n=1 Tax=Oedothorax gibbosus TaxID=931172 RepID=A0AAV6UCY3_9ARAC|nr:hypothetical protein JTE90_017323 [Oedothorax gibbosus]